MKKFLFGALLVASASFANAQTADAVKYPKLDDSPLDVAYYPLNATKSKDGVAPVLRVLYSRPQKKGREVFGVLEQYDKVWRLGANESTELELFSEATIGKKKVKPGRYSLFAIPSKDKWVLIVNKVTDKWGAFSYESAKDIARIEVPVTVLEKPVEALSMTFNKTQTGANLMIAWDTTQVSLPIAFK